MTWPYLVAVDPGLDAAGVAVFNLQAGDPGPDGWTPRENWREVLLRLAAWHVFRTKPADDLCARLNALYLDLADLVQDYGRSDFPVLIEQPAIAGAYAARRGRQRTKGLINGAALAKLHMAVGALIVAGRNGYGRPQLVPAPRLAKALRQRSVLATLTDHGHPLAAHARPSPDLLDAVYLGAAWLTDPQRRIEATLARAEASA